MDEARLRHHILLAMLAVPNVLAALYAAAGVLVSAVRPLPMDPVGEVLTPVILLLVPVALLAPHLMLRRPGPAFAYAVAAAPWLVFGIAMVGIGYLNQRICHDRAPPPGAPWAWCADRAAALGKRSPGRTN